MIPTFDWWELLPWAVPALWIVYLTLLTSGLSRRQILTGATPAQHLRGTPRVSILVAARNEAACIEKCLRSLVIQDYPNLEIIAINDRSTDATGEIMDRLEAEFLGLLRVVHVQSLPSGWMGKTHAMHTGSQAATGEWLCHIDADCEMLSPRVISLALQEAQRRGTDLISITPRFTLDTAWEQMTVPVCSSLMVIWFQPTRVNNPKLSTSYANGAFLMLTRHCLDAVGGWCRFRQQISEDIALSRVVKSSGFRLVVLENEGLYQTRMYDSVRDSWNGWSRIFYGALPRKALVLSLARLVLCSIIPTWGLALCLLLAACRGDGGIFGNALMTATVAAVVLQQIYSALIFRAVGGSVRWSLTAPLGHVVLFGMLGRALLNHAGLATTHWSGAVLRRGQLVARPHSSAAALPSRVTQAG